MSTSPHTSPPGSPGTAPSGVPGRQAIELFLVSFATLLLELALIRWFPAKLRITAYFPNIVLIAAFLGLGVGALSRRGGLPWALVSLASLTLLAILGSRIAFTAEGAGEHLWLLYYDLPADAPVVEGVSAPLIIVFCLTTLPFIGLGTEIARRLDLYATAGSTLLGYSIDLGGSLAGVTTFLVLSSLQTRPILWFAAALVLPVVVLTMRVRSRVVAVLATGLVLLAVHLSDREDLYSPYYGLRVVQQDERVSILANGSLHQMAMDMRTTAFDRGDYYTKSVIVGYQFVVKSLDPLPRRALVLGAGSGNDVAVLLDAGVGEVHAVEIDPAIVELGRAHHPAQPYRDSRVTIHIADAREFLETTDLSFDLIIFGTLDSMTRLSALSNVRLDNFVYTLECIDSARARLTERGALALLFMSSSRYIDEHLFGILAHSFGEPPLLWKGYHQLFNRLFMIGPGFTRLRADPALHDVELERVWRDLDPPTDDWPFLYLESRTIPGFYLLLIAVVLACAVALLVGTSAQVRSDLRARRVDVEMLLFGAAFLLLETGFVTELNLLFGATWKTSAVVFASILAAVLTSTVVASRIRVNIHLTLAIVVALLIAISVAPLRTIAPTEEPGRFVFVLLFCGAPVCAAGLSFASRFAQRREVGAAFGWNVLGAVIGGLCEFSSMALGLRSVFLLAAAFYLLIALLQVRRARPAVAGGGSI